MGKWEGNSLQEREGMAVRPALLQDAAKLCKSSKNHSLKPKKARLHQRPLSKHIPTVSVPRHIPQVWDTANDNKKRRKACFYFSVGKVLNSTGIVQTNEVP